MAAAITGRYPAEGGPGEEFWLVRPMVFMDLHRSEDGTEHRDCFVDSDGVVRLPYGLAGEETVTHWARLPTLPAGKTHGVFGSDVQPALRSAWGPRQS
ncbi:AQJ64_40280 family protein [Nonomuraea sp. NPDC050556]|uniref:AQJ64_40280 family protein n=1 Tax=Nonomuraea sp. NPDC050556 TaxID=3364369 RepID=UPI0037B0DCCF